MNTCSTCKHWGAGSGVDWKADGIGFKRCAGVRERWVIENEAAAQGKPYRDDADKWIERRKEALKAARAYVQDGSEYVADLVTGPDFSCALYEANPSPPSPPRGTEQ